MWYDEDETTIHRDFSHCQYNWGIPIEIMPSIECKSKLICLNQMPTIKMRKFAAIFGSRTDFLFLKNKNHVNSSIELRIADW